MNGTKRFLIYVVLGVTLAALLGLGWVTEANLNAALEWIGLVSVGGFALAAKNTPRD